MKRLGDELFRLPAPNSLCYYLKSAGSGYQFVIIEKRGAADFEFQRSLTPDPFPRMGKGNARSGVGSPIPLTPFPEWKGGNRKMLNIF